jgi:hypothetical protein
VSSRSPVVPATAPDFVQPATAPDFVQPATAPDFVQRVTAVLMAGHGDLLPARYRASESGGPSQIEPTSTSTLTMMR